MLAINTYRRPSRPVQWTLGHLMVVVVICALGLGLFRLSPTMIGVLAAVTGLIMSPPLLARRGWKLTDIAALMTIVLLTIGLMLPAMARTRIHTAGQRALPIQVPTSVYSLLFDER